MRVVIIGEAPNAGVLPVRHPDVLSGSIGRRLAEWAGVTFDEYLERTTRVNLFDYQPQKWDREAARRKAAAIADELRITDVLILLGSRVAESFDVLDWPMYEWKWYPFGDLLYVHTARLPHPSGLNRAYNDPKQRALAGMVMSEAMRVTWPARSDA